VIFRKISTNHLKSIHSTAYCTLSFSLAEVLGGAGGDLFSSVTKVMPGDVTRALEVCLFCHMESFVISDTAYP
jgi:hypothetical protein